LILLTKQLAVVHTDDDDDVYSYEYTRSMAMRKTFFSTLPYYE